MRIAAVADIHGNLPALDAAGRDERHRCAHPALPRRPASRLADTLPPSLRLADDVLCVHGAPGSDLAYWLETVTPDFGRNGSVGLRAASTTEIEQRLGDARAGLVLCGHTHLARSAMTRQGTLVVNPGSVGLPAYDDEHPHRHWVENGTPHARWALLSRASNGWHVARRAVPYDWDAAAREAERHGRLDWSHALRTGRVPVTAAA